MNTPHQTPWRRVERNAPRARSRHIFIGIHRESDHLLNNSPVPGNADDALLMKVGDRLGDEGHAVYFFRDTKHAVGLCKALKKRQVRSSALTVFNMCRSSENLKLLKKLRRREGVESTNSPDSTKRMMRKRLYLRMQALGLSMPHTEVKSLLDCIGQASSLQYPLWIKLAGHHHVNGFGVERAQDADALRAAMHEFAARSVLPPDRNELILQRDLGEGVETKFYGVYSRTRDELMFFRSSLSISPAIEQELRASSLRLARSLGVQVFGGDCIVQDDRPYIIDVNSWPSFRCCADEGSEAIARCLIADYAPRSAALLLSR